MPKITLDSNALAQAASDLDSYIENMEKNISDMRKATQDCYDNLQDSYSRILSANMLTFASDWDNNLDKMKKLRDEIKKKKQKIEESEKILC